MVELVDSLDSGSSVHCGRAGSSPASPTSLFLNKIHGRVVELVDSLDSGSSVHCGRAGSSPASPTRETVERLSLFLLVHPGQNRCVSLLGMKKEYFLYYSPLLSSLHLFASIAIYFAGAPSVWTMPRKVWHFPALDSPCEICKGIFQ